MFYLLFIALTLPFIVLSIFLNKRDGKRILLLYFLVYVFVFCASYRIGVDWYLYESYYYNLEVKFYPEIGYQALSYLFSSIGFDYWLFAFFIKTVVFIIITRYCIKNCELPLLVVFCFFIVTIQFHTDFLRQQVAFALILLAISSFSLLRRSGYFILAATAHFSSILFLPVIFIYKSRLFQHVTFYSTMCLFLFTLVNTTLLNEIIILLNPFLSGFIFFEKIKFYFFFGGGGGVTLGHLVRNALLLLFYILHVKQKNKNDYVLDFFISFVLLTVFYENLLYSSETLWTRLQCYGILFFFLYPIRYFKQNILYMRLSALVVLVYALYSSSGILRESDFYKYYNEYGSVFVHFSDESYQRDKIELLENYWNNWQPRGAD
ncbi:EpsG family protein [Pseudocitrobacter sp. RIT415]|uniref:EpsG family protein n=1 Tax=Pseudocitrobacter sp. RIT415 TaxID=2202163 RepID=UPI000D3BBF32|nr:EpsG family protein [Pseudocitrobacter sp. RIT 415]RAU40206.1 EpsG family protein [Pseudocitrobacter sp. RIT 415]